MSSTFDSLFSDFLLELYHKSYSARTAHLVEWMSAPLSELLAVQGLSWAVGTRCTPRWWVAHYEAGRVAWNDQLRVRNGIRLDGEVSASLSASVTPSGGIFPSLSLTPDGTPLGRDRHHLSSSQLSADLQDPIAMLAVWRVSEAAPCADSDLQHLRRLFPHLLSAYANALRTSLAKECPSLIGRRLDDCGAAITPNGLVLMASLRFCSVLSEELPGWERGVLPDALLEQALLADQSVIQLPKSQCLLNVRRCDGYLYLYANPCPDRRQVKLTPRERQILPLLATTKTLTQIAEELSCTRETVKTHAASIYRKMGVSGKTELARKFGLEGG